MRRVLSVVVGYVVAVASTPLLFAVILEVFPMPMPRFWHFTFGPQAYIAPFMTALIAAFPGFAITRFLLWSNGARSALAFFVAGTLTGLLASMLLTVPGHMFVLYEHGVALRGVAIGGISALIYWWVERLISRQSVEQEDQSVSKPSVAGAELQESGK